MRLIGVICVLLLSTSALVESTFELAEGTEARFYINEVLLGNDKTVVGTTVSVTGTISVDLNDFAAAQVGTISVDASDLTTDDSRRNNAIRRRILNANEEAFQFISFETTAITGLPATVLVGDSVIVQIVGNLRIKDQVREETFDATITIVSATEIHGRASTTILHGDYNLTIPRVPIVASVEDDVILEIEFVAIANE